MRSGADKHKVSPPCKHKITLENPFDIKTRFETVPAGQQERLAPRTVQHPALPVLGGTVSSGHQEGNDRLGAAHHLAEQGKAKMLSTLL